jgi:hypothetical protein
MKPSSPFKPAGVPLVRAGRPVPHSGAVPHTGALQREAMPLPLRPGTPPVYRPSAPPVQRMPGPMGPLRRALADPASASPPPALLRQRVQTGIVQRTSARAAGAPPVYRPSAASTPAPPVYRPQASAAMQPGLSGTAQPLPSLIQPRLAQPRFAPVPQPVQVARRPAAPSRVIQRRSEFSHAFVRDLIGAAYESSGLTGFSGAYAGIGRLEDSFQETIFERNDCREAYQSLRIYGNSLKHSISEPGEDDLVRKFYDELSSGLMQWKAQQTFEAQSINLMLQLIATLKSEVPTIEEDEDNFSSSSSEEEGIQFDSPFGNTLGLAKSTSKYGDRRFHRRASFDYDHPLGEGESLHISGTQNHIDLHKQLDGGGGSFRGNRVKVRMTLHWRTSDDTWAMTSITKPFDETTTFNSSDFMDGSLKPKRLQEVQGLLSHTGAPCNKYDLKSAGNVLHSERDFVVQLDNLGSFGNDLKQAITLATGAKGIPVLLVLDLHSHTIKVCNRCFNVLDSFSNALWKTTLETDIRKAHPKCDFRVVVRTGSDESTGEQKIAQVSKDKTSGIPTFVPDDLPAMIEVQAFARMKYEKNKTIKQFHDSNFKG